MSTLIFVNSGAEVDLTLLQNNDEVVSFAVQNGANPFTLTGYTLTFYLKASATASDGSGYSNNPSVVSAILGEINVTIPRTQLATAGTLFYHIDADSAGSLIGTLVYGTVTVLAI